MGATEDAAGRSFAAIQTPASAAGGTVKVGLAGLGYWGPNLARNFDDLAELAWLCDISAEQLTLFGGRYPRARRTQDFDEMLSDDALHAVVIATPVPTH